MLILNLMSRCNCECPFCCEREEIARAQDIPLDYLKARITEQPADTIIDFFGGEPTLYPHFFEVLSYARKRGHKCRIATNGRLFSNSNFAKRVLDLGIDQIRTSIYSNSDDMHDFHTGAKHSFNQTVTGIKNLITLGVDLFVNIVITSKNVSSLTGIVDMLHDLRVKNIKFSSLTDGYGVIELVPNPKIVRVSLYSALNKAEKYGMAYALEKSPLCIVPERIEFCIYEPDNYLYQKPKACTNCHGTEFCVGFPKEQVHKFGEQIAVPLQIHEGQIHLVLSKILTAEQNEFVSWDDNLESSLTVILKVASTCNLSCDYCYAAKNFSSPTIMSVDIIKSLIDQLADTSYKRIDFNWHGGEPLMAGQNFFKTAIGLQQTSPLNNEHRLIINRLQSNGTLINEDWVGLFKDLDLDVGISLDGPDSIHNSHRLYANGKGSYDRVVNGIKMLNDRQIPVEILSVITPEFVPHSNEIYSFFSSLGQAYPGLIESVNFMPSFEVDHETRKLLPSAVSPSEYAEFMTDLFDLWFLEDNPLFNILVFEEIITVLLGGKSTLCHLKRGCNNFITIEPNGDVYPCDRFSGLLQFRLGNVLKDNLQAILSGNNRREFATAVDAYPPICMDCEWFRVCHGGCLYEAYALSDKLDQPTFYCDGLQKIYRHIDNMLLKYADDYERFVGSGEL